jgi:1,4-dihydroxy-2-naphthoyl-CoA hydrolase
MIPELPGDPAAIAAAINDNRDGWNTQNGLRFVLASSEEVVAELEIGDQHRQAYGIVHGGVYCGIIETLASVGAALYALPRGQSVVGLENHTSFVRAVRQGLLRVRAVPVTRGRRSQLWEGTVQDGDGRVAATGRVRLLCLDPGVEIAGEKVAIKPAGEP